MDWSAFLMFIDFANKHVFYVFFGKALTELRSENVVKNINNNKENNTFDIPNATTF